jgi:hypothetical protein
LKNKNIVISEDYITCTSIDNTDEFFKTLSAAINLRKDLLIGVNEKGKVLGVNPLSIEQDICDLLGKNQKEELVQKLELVEHNFKTYVRLNLSKTILRPFYVEVDGKTSSYISQHNFLVELNHLYLDFFNSEKQEFIKIHESKIDIIKAVLNEHQSMSYSQLQKKLDDVSIGELDKVLVYLMKNEFIEVEIYDGKTTIKIKG